VENVVLPWSAVDGGLRFTALQRTRGRGSGLRRTGRPSRSSMTWRPRATTS